MKKLKQAIKKEEYHHINQEILKILEDNKDEFCTNNYDTLTNARNKLYYMLTRAIIEEAWKVISNDISALEHEKDKINTIDNLGNTEEQVTDITPQNKEVN